MGITVKIKGMNKANFIGEEDFNIILKNEKEKTKKKRSITC